MVTRNKRVYVTIRNDEHFKKIQEEASNAKISQSDLINRIVAKHYDNDFKNQRLISEYLGLYRRGYTEKDQKEYQLNAESYPDCKMHCGYKPTIKTINRIFSESVRQSLLDYHMRHCNVLGNRNFYYAMFGGKSEVSQIFLPMADKISNLKTRGKRYQITTHFNIVLLGEFIKDNLYIPYKFNPIFSESVSDKNSDMIDIVNKLDLFSFKYIKNNDNSFVKIGSGTVYALESKGLNLFSLEKGKYYVTMRDKPKSLKESLKRKGLRTFELEVKDPNSDYSPKLKLQFKALILPIQEVDYK